MRQIYDVTQNLVETVFFSTFIGKKLSILLACLHDQNKSGFFGGPAFIQPIRAI